MKRRDFLKLTMGALGAGMGIKATQAAKPLFIGVDLATPGADKTVYLPVNKKTIESKVAGFHPESIADMISEMGEKLDEANVPENNRFIAETIINPVTFEHKTRLRTINGWVPFHG